MVPIDYAPLFHSICPAVILLVNKITAISEATEPFFRKCMAALRFIRPIGFHVYSQLLRTVGELALVPVGTVPFFREILAERTFGFTGSVA